MDGSTAATSLKRLFITVYRTLFFGRFVFNVAEIMYQNGTRIYSVVQQRRRQVLAEIRQLLQTYVVTVCVMTGHSVFH